MLCSVVYFMLTLGVLDTNDMFMIVQSQHQKHCCVGLSSVYPTEMHAYLLVYSVLCHCCVCMSVCVHVRVCACPCVCEFHDFPIYTSP